MKMLKYSIKRLLLAIVTIFLVVSITFFAMNAIPGGPFTSEKSPSKEVMAMMEAKYGLDKPLFERYLTYLEGLVKFDFGPSIKQRGYTVIGIIKDGFKTSAKLGLIAALIAIAIGIVLGVIAAIKKDKIIDKLVMGLTTAFVAMPSFVLGTLLLILFCVNLGWFPPNGSLPGGLVLPVIALSLYPMAYITRLTRSSMLDVLEQDYVRTAKAKGLSTSKVIFKHSLKNSLIPVATYIGPMIASILTGSMVVEKIFTVSGLGVEFIGSIKNRDYPLIMGTTIFLATLIIIMNFVSDIMYKLLDPRIEF